jgi:hypothetical protein
LTVDEAQSLEEKRGKNQPWQFVKWVFGVLYSPMRTFEEIAENPTVKGPILILLIMLPILLGGQYVGGAKFFLETPTPENELWTEKPSNSTLFLWGSNGNVTFDSDDFVAGNYSVSASLVNSSVIWMHLTGIGSFNCSEEEYSRLSFRIKWLNEANVTPSDATLQLFSFSNESRRFELNISNVIANSTNVWANVSINLATDNWIETPQSLPSWSNITGIGFLLSWANAANLTLKIDDLFFGKYESISSSTTFGTQLLYSLIRGGVNFLLEWVILSGVVLLSLKSFSDWKGLWKNLLSILGYVYSASIIYLGALALLFFVLPPIFLPYHITYFEYLDIYQRSWGLPISILNLLSYGWITILCTIALKKIHELSWSKAFLIGLGAVVMSLLFSSFLLSAFL